MNRNRCWPSSTSSATACEAGSSRTISRTCEAHRRDGAPASGADCRDQDRALHRARLGAGRGAVEAGTVANVPIMVNFGSNLRSGHSLNWSRRKFRARRHLHARVHPACAASRTRRVTSTRDDRGPEARRDLQMSVMAAAAFCGASRFRPSRKGFCRIRFQPISTSGA